MSLFTEHLIKYLSTFTMKLILCYLAATITSSGAATESANNNAPRATISPFVFVKYLVPGIDLTKLGDHENIDTVVN